MSGQRLRVNPKDLIPQQTKRQMSGSVVKKLAAHMKRVGYDESQPISGVRRSDGRIVISDGHHRRETAILAGIDEVPVDVYELGADPDD